jgi:Gram-negative bacterial TonB protein C-terminal
MTSILAFLCMSFAMEMFSYNTDSVDQFDRYTLSQQLLTGKKDTTEDPGKIFTRVETEAGFPGGEKAWRNFLENRLDPSIPVRNNAPAGTYVTIIQFIVDTIGNVKDFTPLTKHGFGMEEEVIRVLKKGPKWIPATQNGKKVIAYRKQPVSFFISPPQKSNGIIIIK